MDCSTTLLKHSKCKILLLPSTKDYQKSQSRIFFFHLVLRKPKTDFDNKKNFQNFIGLKEPYLDVILYLGNKKYQPPLSNKKPLNEICFILDWEQNLKKVKKKVFF